MSKQLHDVRMKLHHETQPGKTTLGALLVSETGDKDKAVWLPKSQIEFVEVPGKSGYLDITMPLWLAEEKELV